MRAVGSNQQARRKRFAIGECYLNGIVGIFKAGHGARTQVDAELFCLCHQCIHQMAVFDHMGEGLAFLYLATESKKCWSHRIVEL